ncbi:unnamed protein product, partial [Ectocarpus sp. 8 AP-2014]
HPAAAYLRACCLFLWCIPEVVASSSSSQSSRASDAAVPAVILGGGAGERDSRLADSSKTLPEASKVGGPTTGTAGDFAGGRGAAYGVWPAIE